jgi:hypothetical protein
MSDTNYMTNWKEESGIPHEDGKIKWYIIGTEDSEYHYLGEYDMTDWDKTWDVIYAEAEKIIDKYQWEEWNVVRKDLLIDMMWNIFWALGESGDRDKEWIDLEEIKKIEIANAVS